MEKAQLAMGREMGMAEEKVQRAKEREMGKAKGKEQVTPPVRKKVGKRASVNRRANRCR